MDAARERPTGLTALSVFFALAALVSSTAAVSLFWRHGPLEPMWRINPRALAGFTAMGSWAGVLLLIVCAACVLAAVGVWRGARWGHLLALIGLAINLVGDAVNAVFGADRRAAIGVPIVAALMLYLLSRRVRKFFAAHRR